MKSVPPLRGALLGILLASIHHFFLVESKDICVKLPRIEVQFLCNQPLLQEGFNATEIFQEFLSTEIFPERLFNQSSGSNSSTTTTTSRYNNTYINENYDFQMYVSVGINTARDVSPNEWFYHRCDLESSQTLVTIDVRGYNRFLNYPNPEFVGNGVGMLVKENWWLSSPYRDSFETIQSYLSSKVCSDNSFDFYRSSITAWDETRYPMPEMSQSDVDGDSSVCGIREPYTYDKFARNVVRGGGQVVYPSSSILRYDGLPSNNTLSKDAYVTRYEVKVGEHGYHYDHDLYDICEDPSYLLFSNDDEDVPSPLFWLLGVLVGYFMVFMIKAEFDRPLRYEQLPRRTLSSNNRNTSHNNDDDDDDDDDEDDSNGNRSQRNGQEIELMTLNNQMV